MAHLYFDYNATTPLWPEVAQAMLDAQSVGYANPASQHGPGREARRVLEDARDQIASLLGLRWNTSQPDRLIFTSGGTEANNLAIRGLAGSPPGRILISSIEHPSVTEVAEHLAGNGWRVERIRASKEGVVDLEHLESLLAEPARLVSIMLANNETGVIQPVAAAAELCQRAGVPLHTDAVQAAGKQAIDFDQLGAAAVTISAHKFNGPRGIGALAVKAGVSLEPLLFGGFQQGGLRPGTENVVPAIGMAQALSLWTDRRDALAPQMRRLQEQFEAGLCDRWPEAVIHGRQAERLPHTSNVSFPGRDRQALVIALDLAGVACSTGSACASGSSEPSPALIAMGLAPELVGSSLRFSWGAETSPQDVEELIARIIPCCQGLPQTH